VTTFILFVTAAVIIMVLVGRYLFGGPVVPGPGAIYEERCGGVIGWLGLSPPMIHVTVRPDSLELKYLGYVLMLRRDEITGVGTEEFFFRKAVRISHSNQDAPSEVLLFSRRRDLLVSSLNAE
jgi:hypothetical protein